MSEININTTSNTIESKGVNEDLNINTNGTGIVLINGSNPLAGGGGPFAIEDATNVNNSPVPHRYWRLKFEVSNAGLGLDEVEFRATVGGGDETGSGTASASSTASGSPSNVFDDTSGTVWVGTNFEGGTADYWIQYDFGSGNDVHVAQYTVKNTTIAFNNPSNVTLQYSDDGSVWFDAGSETGITWSGVETKTYLSSLTSGWSDGDVIKYNSSESSFVAFTLPTIILSNIVEDTTPQLGGDLDINSFDIVSTSNTDIKVLPNGTGNVWLGNYKFNVDQSVGVSEDEYVLTYDNTNGLISLKVASGGGGGADGYLYYGGITTAPTANGNFGNNLLLIGDNTEIDNPSGFASNHQLIGKSVKLLGTPTSPSDNTFIGNNISITGTSVLEDNVILGHSISENMTSSSQFNRNVLIGQSPGVASTTATQIDVVAIGTSTIAGKSSVALGNTANATGADSICILDSDVTAINSICLGKNNTVDTTRSTAIGNYGRPHSDGEFVISNGASSAAGDSQFSVIMMRALSSGFSEDLKVSKDSEGITTAPTGIIVLPNNSSVVFDVDIVARSGSATDNTKAWKVQFVMARDASAATTALVGSVTTTVIGETANGGFPSTWTITVTADTTNGGPKIAVQASTGGNIYFVAAVHCTTIKR